MEKELIHEVENKLVEIVGRSNVYVKASPIPEFDWMLYIRGYEFLCEVKKTVTRSNFGSIQMKLRTWQENTDKPVLLVAQNIYPLLMDEFAHLGINSLDSAGNCRINVGDLLMHIEGRKVPPKLQATSANRSRLFQEAGIRIIFRILLEPDWLNLSYRQMQLSTNVSLGSITVIMNELLESGYLLKTNKGKFLKNKQDLLERWVVAYNEILKPKQLIRRMTFKNAELRKNWADLKLPSDIYWGGEPAANLVDGYLYPELFTLYGGTMGDWVKAGLRPDDEGEVFVYKKFWSSVEQSQVTPALLIYADLMGSGNSRNIEAAQRIYNNELQYLQ